MSKGDVPIDWNAPMDIEVQHNFETCTEMELDGRYTVQ